MEISFGIILLIVIIIIAGACIQSALGFGFTMLSMTFIPPLLGYGKALALSVSMVTVSTILISFRYRKYIRWKVMMPFLIPTAIICGITNVLSASVNSDVMYTLLGVMLIAVAVYFFVFSEKIKIRPTVKTGTVMGAICGICYGLFATGGPTAAMYLLPSINDKKEYLATMQAFLAVNNTLVLCLSLIMGKLSFDDLPVMGFGYVGLLIGSLLGLYVFKRIPAKQFSRVIYAFIGISGVWIIVSHLI